MKTARIQLSSPALVLAPMEGVTDAPMRELLSQRGGFSFSVSEFLRISQDVPSKKVFYHHVPELRTGTTPSGLPVQLQLLGGDSEKMARAARTAVEAGAHSVDLNFGCPAPTVNRHDGGATLLKYPERVREIVRAVRSAVPSHIPVSAKVRLGWDNIEDIHANADMAAEGGADWITIHARTKMQGYAPPVYWAPIGEVRRRLNIPVVANGDIWTLDDFRRCRDITGCEHFMIGRSALADPALPLKLARELSLNTAIAEEPIEIGSSARHWLPLLENFAALCAQVTENNGYSARRIKQWVRMSHVRNPIGWYETIKRLDTTDEILNHLRDQT